jgi:hypothetical protein
MVLASPILIFGWVHLAISLSQHVTPPVHVISGAFMEKVNRVYTYEGSIPLIFQVELPHLEVVSPAINCTAPTYICDTMKWVWNTYSEMKAVFDRDFKHSQPSYFLNYWYTQTKNDTSVRRERGLLKVMGW